MNNGGGCEWGKGWRRFVCWILVGEMSRGLLCGRYPWLVKSKCLTVFWCHNMPAKVLQIISLSELCRLVQFIYSLQFFNTDFEKCFVFGCLPSNPWLWCQRHDCNQRNRIVCITREEKRLWQYLPTNHVMVSSSFTGLLLPMLFLVGLMSQRHTKCVSGTNLFRRLFVLPQSDGSCWSDLLSDAVAVHWQWPNLSKHWPYNVRSLAG